MNMPGSILTTRNLSNDYLAKAIVSLVYIMNNDQLQVFKVKYLKKHGVEQKQMFDILEFLVA